MILNHFCSTEVNETPGRPAEPFSWCATGTNKRNRKAATAPMWTQSWFVAFRCLRIKVLVTIWVKSQVSVCAALQGSLAMPPYLRGPTEALPIKPRRKLNRRSNICWTVRSTSAGRTSPCSLLQWPTEGPAAQNNWDKHLDWVAPHHLSANKAFILTLSNSGGGLFPLHKFDRAQTAFRVIVSLVDFVRSLKRQRPWITILDVEASKGIKRRKTSLILRKSNHYSTCCSSSHAACDLSLSTSKKRSDRQLLFRINSYYS